MVGLSELEALRCNCTAGSGRLLGVIEGAKPPKASARLARVHVTTAVRDSSPLFSGCVWRFSRRARLFKIPLFKEVDLGKSPKKKVNAFSILQEKLSTAVRDRSPFGA